MRNHDLKSPYCGNAQKTAAWGSFNVTLDPELKKKLLQARINVFVCRNCRKTAFINAPILYHDMTQQSCVQNYPREKLDDASFFHQFKADGTITVAGISPPPRVAAMTEYLARPHIVFDINEMISYVRFREGIWIKEHPAKRKKTAPP